MDDVMRLCCEISAHDQIRVAVKNSTKGAMVAGGTAFVGGLLGGPPGIAVGKIKSVAATKCDISDILMTPQTWTQTFVFLDEVGICVSPSQVERWGVCWAAG